MIEDVLAGRKRLPDVIASKARGRRKAKAFTVAPAVTISNSLSNKFTVVEVECLDRPGLLSEITAVLSDLSLDIASAHITTFGEKVIDTFYVTDLFGHKITNENRQAHTAARLKAVMAGEGRRRAGQDALRHHRRVRGLEAGGSGDAQGKGRAVMKSAVAGAAA